MKTVRRILSVLMAVLLFVGVMAPSVSAVESDFARPVDAHIHFRADGTLKIMQIADLQDDDKVANMVIRLLRSAVETIQPDLIVMSGDNFAGYDCPTKEEAQTAIRAYMDVLETYGIPVAIVFGNHDDDGTAFTKEEQIDFYSTYSCFIGCKGVIADLVTESGSTRNVGTYNIPVFASADSDQVLYNIWCFDSGNYNPDPAYGGYSYVLPEQVDWYVRTSEQLQRDNGGKVVPSVAFQHIVPVQIYKALKEIPVWIPGAVRHEKKYYRFPDGTDLLHNWMHEDPCAPNILCEAAYAEVDAMANRGDVQAIFFGHDHVNGYSVPYKGIDLVNTPACSLQTYNDFHFGFRVIELDQKDLQTYNTRLVNNFTLLFRSLITRIIQLFRLKIAL